MSPTNPFSEGANTYLQPRHLARREAEQALAAVCPQLTALGVARVEITYDGYCDSGTIKQITATAGERPIELPTELCAALADAAERLLPLGWEINEGAFGQLILDVARRQVRRQHHWRVRATDCQEETFAL